MEQPKEKPASALREGLMLGPQRQFKLQAEVARMALGQLWRVMDLGPGSRTTLNLMFVDPALVADPRSNETIKKQINAKQLKHQHLVEQHGFFQLKNGWLAVTQEALDGISVNSLIESGNISRLQPRQLKVLLGQVAIALDFMAKTHGHAHGALCPELIFVNRGAGVKLAGQGLRPALDGINDQLSAPLSYPHYQAPEAFHPGNVSAQADTYSLGCIAYQILTGELAYRMGKDGERSRNHDKQPRNISDRQWLTLQRALSENPADRPTSAPALIQALFIEEKEDKAAEATALDELPGAPPAGEPTSSQSNMEPPPSQPGKPVPQAEKTWFNRPVAFSLGLLAGLSISAFLYLLIAPGEAASLDTLNPTPDGKLTAGLNASQNQTGTHASAANPGDPPASPLTTEQTEAIHQNPQSTDLSHEKRPSQTLFRDMIDSNTYGPEMVVIPAGQFSRGDNSSFADDNEKPAHLVDIQRGFGLSRYEVTFSEYDQFAKATGRPLPDDESWGRGRQPVMNVTWQDAWDYSQWLAQTTGEPYRLPTESEWEYAARAGTQSRYSWGEKMLQGFANCDECGSHWGGKQAAPVGSLKPNPWGLYDMAGNVDEWVADCYMDNYTKAPADGRAHAIHGCKEHTMRGGSWFDIARLMRPSSRYRNPADGKRNSWGFRVALDINPRILNQ